MSIITRFLHQFRQQFRQPSNKRYLLRGSIAAFLIQMAGLGFGFISSWLLARLLGADGYGTYVYIFAWIGLLSSFCTWGFDSLLVREMAVFRQKKQLAAQKGIFQLANFVVICCSFLLTIALHFFIECFFTTTFSSPSLNQFITANQNYQALFQWAIWTIPLLALLRIWQASLRGYQQITHSQLPELLVKPLLFLLSVILFYYLINKHLATITAIQINIFSLIITAVVCGYFIYQKIYPHLYKQQSTYQSKIWLKSAFSFLMISLISLLNVRADVLMLGTLAEAEAVGMYNIAARLSELLKLLLVVVNIVFSPLIANLYSSGKIVELQKMVSQVTRTVFVLAMPLALLLVVFSGTILRFFGDDFVYAQTALFLLCIGQLFNIACGSVGNLLLMTGYERLAFIGLSISTLVNILLNALLIPSYGLNGAAAATMVSLIIWNSILWVMVWRKLKINAAVLGFSNGKGKKDN